MQNPKAQGFHCRILPSTLRINKYLYNVLLKKKKECIPFWCIWASLVAQMVKYLPAMWETRIRFLGREDPLEKEMAIHSSTLAWKIPWMEEPDRLQSMGSQRVGHDWATSLLHFKTLLEWAAICYSQGSSWPRDWTCVFCVSCISKWVLYQLSHQWSSDICM